MLHPLQALLWILFPSVHYIPVYIAHSGLLCSKESAVFLAIEPAIVLIRIEIPFFECLLRDNAGVE